MPKQRREAQRSQAWHERARAFVDLWVDLFGRHQILAYASGIAFRTLVALIPLLLLGFAVLGALHRSDVWTHQLGPPVAAKVTQPVFHAIDSTVKRIFTHDTAPLIAFAAALTIWDVSSSVRACMGGMNAIYDCDETRPTWRRFAVSLALGIAIAVALVGSVLLITAARGWGGVGLAVVRWLGAALLIALAVGALVRYGPAESRAKRWDSFGTSLVVASWIVASVIFKLFVQHVANFRSALGILAAFLVLTTYVYVSSIVFLIGVQVDELLRTDRGLISLLLRR